MDNWKSWSIYLNGLNSFIVEFYANTYIKTGFFKAKI